MRLYNYYLVILVRVLTFSCATAMHAEVRPSSLQHHSCLDQLITIFNAGFYTILCSALDSTILEADIPIRYRFICELLRPCGSCTSVCVWSCSFTASAPANDARGAGTATTSVYPIGFNFSFVTHFFIALFGVIV